MQSNQLIMIHKLLVAFLFAVSTFQFGYAQNGGNGKKVYADYHGTRYTREHDGMLGRWSFYDDTKQSATALKRLSYNADNILENGKNDVAAVSFPLAGMQSNLDPDFIEYQILTAKTAKIDGFFIEWGFPEHESTLLLNAMQNVAAKYNFEIGVNWCDGWLYYDWITKVNPNIKTRFDKTQHFKYSFQYLMDNVFSSSTSPKVNGKPVFYLFGGGITPQEYKSVISPENLKIPAGTKFPDVLRRVAEWGKIQNNTYIPADMGSVTKDWEALNMSTTAWIPARVRPMDSQFPLWDQYATKDDVIRFMQPFKDAVWDGPNPNNHIKSGFVTPGMDNRGCAGWGRGHFFYIPRENGKTYDEMWEFNLRSKDSLDMVLIASWSDYTEGHEIEPTVEDGYTALNSTLKYASQFKDEKVDTEGTKLPLKLFQIRKSSKFLKSVGIDSKELDAKLNEAAQFISNGKYEAAKLRLEELDKLVEPKSKSIKTTSYTQDKTLLMNGKKQNNGVFGVKDKLLIKLDSKLVNRLLKNHYTGFFTFEYLDDKVQKLELVSHTTKLSKSKFSVVSEIRTNNSKNWKSAKVELYNANIDLSKTFAEQSNFMFRGMGTVRNIKFSFNLHQIK